MIMMVQLLSYYQPCELFHQLEGLEAIVECIQLSQAAETLGFGSPPPPGHHHHHQVFYDDVDFLVVIIKYFMMKMKMDGHLFKVQHVETKYCVTDEQFSSLLR